MNKINLLRMTYSIAIVIISFVVLSCGGEEAPIPLQANAGEDLTGAVNATIQLDGSKSTGPDGYVYVWLLTSSPANLTESQITLQGPNTPKPTFVPPKNGQYLFTLRLMRDGLISEDQVTVTISGILDLPATVNAQLRLVDIEPDPTKPDYRANANVTVQDGGNLISEGSIVIQFAETAGLVMEGGVASIKGAHLTSSNGWKGIWVKGGNLAIESATKIEKAGKSAFDGQSETASIVQTAGILNVRETTFTGSAGTYDVLSIGGSLSDLFGNQFVAAKPVKTSFANLNKINSTLQTTQDYFVLTTPGASTLVSNTAGFTFQPNLRYYIDGDITVSANITLGSNTQIKMKQGAGIVISSGALISQATSSAPAILEGLGGAAWRGLAITSGAGSTIINLEIRKAGSEVFNTGSFASMVKAAIYFSGSAGGEMQGVKILDSQGYGVYIATPPFTPFNIRNATISNAASAAVSVDITNVGGSITSPVATITTPPGIPAVEVRANTTTNAWPTGTWPALGSNNYYLVKGNVRTNDNWALAAGVHLKFEAGRSLLLGGNPFLAVGTANQPIVFDSEAGAPGTWAGIFIESNYRMEFCQIKNGGDSFLFHGNGVTSASEKANVVFNYSGTSVGSSFINNTISGSAGWGVLVEAGKNNPNAEPVNTFNNNASGNVIVK